MTRLGRRLPLWLSVVLALAIAFNALPGDAQTGQPAPFRLTHTIDKGTQAQVTVTGRVFNEARSDAIDVYVTAEALDGAGKIMATGVSYVGTVAAGNSAAFIIKVPAARTAANFRVLVTGYRFGFGIQS
jgi:hypothetical protein